MRRPACAINTSTSKCHCQHDLGEGNPRHTDLHRDTARRLLLLTLLPLLLLLLVQFEFELGVARMVLGDDADVLGGLTANSRGWLGASDETHCGKMATLKVSKGGPRGCS